jgi:hypothetical protein
MALPFFHARRVHTWLGVPAAGVAAIPMNQTMGEPSARLALLTARLVPKLVLRVERGTAPRAAPSPGRALVAPMMGRLMPGPSVAIDWPEVRNRGHPLPPAAAIVVSASTAVPPRDTLRAGPSRPGLDLAMAAG